MRDKRGERQQQWERGRARDKKERLHERGGLQDLSARLPETACVTLDLHGDTRDGARRRIPKAVEEAKGRGLAVVKIIHGFNRGSDLSDETQKVLFRLKQQSQVASYAVNGVNPGETIVYVK